MSRSKPDDATRNLKTERLNEMAFSFKKTGALLAAIEVGLFTAISQGSRTLDEISRAIGIGREATDRLLIVCKVLGLVEEAGGEYTNAGDVERYLVRDQRAYFGDYLVYQAGSEYDSWKSVAANLRGGGEPDRGKIYLSLMSDPDEARRFTVAGYNSSLSLAHKLAKEFDFSPYRRWLDCGGGSGCYSIAACERNPGLETIILDLPNVIAVTKEFVAKHGLEKRIRTVAGNFFEAPFPEGCDLISFITPLQGYMPDEVIRLLTKSHRALVPGGTLLVLDYMLNDDKTGPLDPALMNLQGVQKGQLLGRVNSGAEFREFFTAAGFKDVSVRWFMPHQLGLVTADKAG